MYKFLIIFLILIESTFAEIEVKKDGDINEWNIFALKELLPKNFDISKEEAIRLIKQNRLFAYEYVHSGQVSEADEYALDMQKYVYFSNKYKQKLLNNIKISNKILKSYYLANKKEFIQDANYKLSHIVVDKRSDIQKIKKSLELNSSKENFINLAKTYSMDPSVNYNNSFLGVFKVKDLKPKVLQAINKAEKNSNPYTDIITYDENYFIYYIDNFNKERKLSFEESKAKIEAILKQRKRLKIVDDEYERLLK